MGRRSATTLFAPQTVIRTVAVSIVVLESAAPTNTTHTTYMPRDAGAATFGVTTLADADMCTSDTSYMSVVVGACR